MSAHVYGGGFVQGLKEAGVNHIGSLETWPVGFAMADLIGIKRIDKVRKCDLFVSNPPCSRFSSMSSNRFSKESKRDLSLFCELTESLTWAKESKARTIWWENGPAAFTSGREIIQNAHEFVGAKTTLVLKIDPSWSGNTQLRPRTHVIHFKDKIEVKGLPAASRPQVSVKQWLDERLGSIERIPAPDLRYYSMNDPVSQIQAIDPNKGFNSCKPALINEDQAYAYAVLSSRQFAWEQENRWWSIQEYVASMTFPLDIDYGKLNYPIYKILSLLSKGVMPAVSKYVYSNIVNPLMNDKVLEGPHRPDLVGDIYYVRMLANRKARDLVI